MRSGAALGPGGSNHALTDTLHTNTQSFCSANAPWCALWWHPAARLLLSVYGSVQKCWLAARTRSEAQCWSVESWASEERAVSSSGGSDVPEVQHISCCSVCDGAVISVRSGPGQPASVRVRSASHRAAWHPELSSRSWLSASCWCLRCASVTVCLTKVRLIHARREVHDN